MKRKIAERARAGKIAYTMHAQQRMDERRTLIEEVLDVMLNGDIVEEYPDTKPLPSCLMMKQVRKNEPLYVLCAINDEATVVTVHWHDPEKWLTPTRRKPKK